MLAAPQNLWEPGLPALLATRFNSYTALIPSRASPLPQKIRSASGLEGATEPVKAGLPAMQTTRFNSCTALIPSRASPLPQGIRSASGLEGANEPVGAGLPAMQTTRFNSCTALIPSRASPLPQRRSRRKGRLLRSQRNGALHQPQAAGQRTRQGKGATQPQCIVRTAAGGQMKTQRHQ